MGQVCSHNSCFDSAYQWNRIVADDADITMTRQIIIVLLQIVKTVYSTATTVYIGLFYLHCRCKQLQKDKAASPPPGGHREGRTIEVTAHWYTILTTYTMFTVPECILVLRSHSLVVKTMYLKDKSATHKETVGYT